MKGLAGQSPKARGKELEDQKSPDVPGKSPEVVGRNQKAVGSRGWQGRGWRLEVGGRARGW